MKELEELTLKQQQVFEYIKSHIAKTRPSHSAARGQSVAGFRRRLCSLTSKEREHCVFK